MYAVNDIEKQLGRYKSIYDYAEAENSLKRLFERCQKVEKENLQNSLPPSYVCEESEFYSELDLSC